MPLSDDKGSLLCSRDARVGEIGVKGMPSLECEGDGNRLPLPSLAGGRARRLASTAIGDNTTGSCAALAEGRNRGSSAWEYGENMLQRNW